jgi:hypothetical protein
MLSRTFYLNYTSVSHHCYWAFGYMDLTLHLTDTLETLTRRYGEAFMATTPCSFVITVPAVWWVRNIETYLDSKSD